MKILGITSLPISWTGKSDYIPSGCSLGKRKNKPSILQQAQQTFLFPTFETSTTGLGKGRYDQTPICKDPEAKNAVGKNY